MPPPLIRFTKLSNLLKEQWLHAPVMRYVYAILATIASVLVRRTLDPWLGNSAVFVTVFPVIAFNAFYLGVGPAVLSVALGLVGVNYFVVNPKNAFSLTPLDYAASVAYAGVSAVLVVGVAEASRRTYRRLQRVEAALHASETEKARMEAVTEERNRLARELHDTTAQELTGIILQLEIAEGSLSQNPEKARLQVISAQELARESLREMRTAVRNLHSHSSQNSDLRQVIEKMAQKVLFGLQIDASVGSRGIVRKLPYEIEFGLLRISQEAITNAMKHSRASKIRVELSYEESHVQMSVEDNGKGFIPAAPREKGLGLTSMRERAEGLGGEWSVHSIPGEGTRIQVVVPVLAQEPQTPTGSKPILAESQTRGQQRQ